MAPRSARRAAGATLAALASGYVLDRRYGFYRDISTILREKSSAKVAQRRIEELGDNVTIYNMMLKCQQDAEALWFEGRTWTYAQLKKDVDKFAAILEKHSIAPGESVGVFTTNSPEMVIAFIAVTKLGAVPAMINATLRSQTLLHCLNIAKAKLLVCTPDLASALVDVFDETGRTTPCLVLNLSSFPPLSLPSSPNAEHITQIRYEDLNATPPSTTPLPKRALGDSCALIYTSGTSGKPKAVNIKGFLTIAVSNPNPYDRENPKRYYPVRTYACLPLFHGTCLFTGLYYTVGNSGALCLARKFSASNFSKDLVDSRATRFIYVGELCRYLIRAPPSPHDTAHRVIVAAGNGLAKDVWVPFQRRFNIPEIREFYRSTEGIAKFDNHTGEAIGAGHVGFHGPIRRWFERETYLVKYDPDTESPWRDPTTGFCRPVSANEPGEAIGRISNWSSYMEYLDNPAATESKIVRDVFEKGDAFQRMGDLLVRDTTGWISFHDRTGDTYRWRGENVSAGEVRDHISRLPEVEDCSVFAVKLPGYDGQAGAVGITLKSSTGDEERNFVKGLYARLRKGGMTTWQVPRLVRVVDEVKITATFKHAKEVLKGRSWDPSVKDDGSGDRKYWLCGEEFVRLEEGDWKEIVAGRARL